VINFLGNATSWDEESDRLIPGGQLSRYYGTVFDALKGLGVEYTVTRQPVRATVGVYPNGRDCYHRGSQRLHRISVGVSHGIASKHYLSSKHRQYDLVLVPGPAHKVELVATGCPRRKIYIAGYPKLDPLLRGEVNGSGVWTDDGRIRVLYAPTHGGGSERHAAGNRHAPGARATSWWHRDQVTRLLSPDHFEVVLAPHPRHSKGKKATFEQYTGADVVVADGGSTIYESLVLGLPVVLPAWLTRRRNEDRAGSATLESYVYRNRIGYQADAAGEFAGMVITAAASGLSPLHAAFAETILPTDLRGRGGQIWAQHLAEVHERAAAGPGRRRRLRVQHAAGQDS